MDTIDFMQQVALRASELQVARPKATTKEWKLGYKMLFNPKLHCPFCDDWIESKRVWMVDEDTLSVKRVWKLDGTKIGVTKCHPHVGIGGKICRGSARTASEALVAGIAGRDDYVEAWNWFPEQLGHSCPNMEEAASVGRFNRHLDDPFEDEEHEGENFCESCYEWFHEDDTYFCSEREVNYCSNCWSDTHSTCEDCGSDIHTHLNESCICVGGRYEEEYVCEECYQDKYFTCEKCDDAMLYEKCEKDDICKECWAEDHFRCSECEEWFELGQLDAENKCADCRQFICQECELGTDEIIDGKCRACHYGTGEGQLSLLEEEASDGSL